MLHAVHMGIFISVSQPPKRELHRELVEPCGNSNAVASVLQAFTLSLERNRCLGVRKGQSIVRITCHEPPHIAKFTGLNTATMYF